MVEKLFVMDLKKLFGGKVSDIKYTIIKSDEIPVTVEKPELFLVKHNGKEINAKELLDDLQLMEEIIKSNVNCIKNLTRSGELHLELHNAEKKKNEFFQLVWGFLFFILLMIQLFIIF